MIKKEVTPLGIPENKKYSFLGVTLIFYKEDDNSITGFLKSYSVKQKSYQSLILSIKHVSNLESQHNGIIYLGINDIYKVSDKASVGEFLGRSSMYDLKTYKLAKSIIGSGSNFSPFSNYNEVRNCSLIYYYSGKKHRFTFTVLTVLECKSQEQLYDTAYEIGTRPEFLKKIKRNSSDNISIKNVHFVGIESSFVVKDLYTTGCYQEFNASFSHIDFVKEELMSEKKIIKNFSKISSP